MLIKNINKFREGRCHIDTLLIFDALQTLTQNFFHDHGIFLQVGVILAQVQEQSYEGRLTIGGHQGIDLVLDGLYAAL